MNSTVTTEEERTGHTFRPEVGWGPASYSSSLSGEATCVAVDSSDRVYVFNRGPSSVVVFDRDGNEVEAWGDTVFVQPHGIAIDREDNLYLVDRSHFLQKRSPDGQVLLTIGSPGHSAIAHSGEPFHRPTDVAVHPHSGDIFVTDGYGNSRVHRFDPAGVHIMSWGRPGSDIGELCLPHGIALLDADILAVCDRENFRLQLFTIDGEYVEQRPAFHPMAVRADGNGLLYTALGGPPKELHGLPNLGNRVIISDAASGDEVGYIGSATPGLAPDQMLSPHGIAIDSSGAVYVADVSATFSRAVLGEHLERAESVSLHKWSKV